MGVYGVRWRPPARWNELQSLGPEENIGFVTLQNFDPEAYDMLEKFREFGLEHFDNYVRFFHLLDKDGKGYVSKDNFHAFLAKVKTWDGDPNLLFSYLRPLTVTKDQYANRHDPKKCPYLTLSDILPRQHERALLDDMPTNIAMYNKALHSHGLQ